MAQAEMITSLLQPAFGTVEIVTIKTSGDLGERDRLGAFVREIQEALLEDRVDVGLHCLKDLPTEPVRGLSFGAYLEREDPQDATLSPRPWRELPSGAVIGTGSLRRSAQLAAIRPDFRFKPLVGNVDTRLRKLMEGEYEAIVLAVAGLKRLGLMDTWDSSPYAGIQIQGLSSEEMLPAAGQAILVLECADSRQDLREKLLQFDHAVTRRAAIAERAFLRTFGGGCSLPVAALAVIEGDRISLTGLVSSPNGQTVLREETSGEDAERLGTALSKRMITMGALDLFERVPMNAGGNDH
jgi:hydroxymethylbilane synthase